MKSRNRRSGEAYRVLTGRGRISCIKRRAANAPEEETAKAQRAQDPVTGEDGEEILVSPTPAQIATAFTVLKDRGTIEDAKVLSH